MPVLPLTGATLRVFVHVVAATLWVGAMVASAWLEPRVQRSESEELWLVADGVRSAAWVAYLVLWATGIANLVAVGAATESSRYGASVVAKLGLVVASGVSFWAMRDRSSARVTVWMATVATLGALGALLVGVQLGDAA